MLRYLERVEKNIDKPKAISIKRKDCLQEDQIEKLEYQEFQNAPGASGLYQSEKKMAIQKKLSRSSFNDSIYTERSLDNDAKVDHFEMSARKRQNVEFQIPDNIQEMLDAKKSKIL